MNFREIERTSGEHVDFREVEHLVESAGLLGIDVRDWEGLGEGSDELWLRRVAADAAEAVAAKLRDDEAKRRRRRPCGIGPYADGRCTICGLSQPE